MRLSNAILFIFIIVYSCSPSKHIESNNEITRLKFLNEYDIPFNKEFQNTIVGGLSGIDYDPTGKLYYIISDDKSEKNFARFYKVKINISNDKIDSVVFLQTIFLKTNEGKVYPGVVTDPLHTPDPESIRYNPKTNTATWSSEGERIIKKDNIVLEDPAVTDITPDGYYLDTFQLPQQMHISVNETGPRRNGVFEGLTFADNYKSLYVNVEEPLYNDGSRAGLNDSTGVIRIIKFDAVTKNPIAQYAYTVDAVADPPVPQGAFIINGVSEILSIGADKLLITERSYSTGKPGCNIRIYIADLANAQDIGQLASLKNQSIKKATKKLLLNMNDLGIYIDNIEGVTFGPLLPNGHRTLLFISDNNFDTRQKTQLLLFEIEECLSASIKIFKKL